MKKKIVFIWEYEKRIKISEVGKSDSLFFEAYRRALAGVTEIVRSSIMYEPDNMSDPLYPSKDENAKYKHNAYNDPYFYDYPNNVIVFSGERGAGKSSAMLTFVNSLENKDSLVFKDKFVEDMANCELPEKQVEAVKRMLGNSVFVSLPPIDPTALEDDGLFLLVILVRLFKLVSETWEMQTKYGLNDYDSMVAWEKQIKYCQDDGSARNRGQQLKYGLNSYNSARDIRLRLKNELMRSFNDCFEHIQAIKGKNVHKLDYEGLEALAEYGDSSYLKVELAELVKKVLRFCRPNDDSTFLVLQIDDTDMNIKQAYAILEDIRRYLVIPHVIIVMAADLKHLTQVVQSTLMQDYDKDLLTRQEYTKKIAYQYINKLFPQTRQINLPSLGSYFREHTDNIEIVFKIKQDDSGDYTILPDARGRNAGVSENGEKNDLITDPQKQIFRLIYRKTGVVFLKQPHGLHYIIPANMRLLAHFLSMLAQMEDVDDPDSEEPELFCGDSPDNETINKHVAKLQIRLQNVQRLQEYLLTNWASNNLGFELEQTFNELERIDIFSRMQYICIQLKNLLLSYKEDKKNKKSKQNKQNKQNDDTPKNDYRYRYVDMITMCRQLANISAKENEKRFVFAVKTYFSLLAHAIVIEDLIEYYIEYLNKKNYKAYFGCSFARLYNLFGSRIFPYLDNLADKSQIKIKIGLLGTDKTSENKNDIALHWYVEPGNIQLIQDKALKRNISWFYSLLADYKEVDTSDRFIMDLCTPIVNCLYLGDDQIVTRLVATVPGGNKVDRLDINLNDWHSMGNSALLTVLNSDVQQRIMVSILNFLEKNKSGIQQGGSSAELQLRKIEYGEWISSLREFYNKIIESFNEENSPAIRALEKLKFDGWLNDIEINKVEVNSYDKRTEWQDAFKRLVGRDIKILLRQEDVVQDHNESVMLTESDEKNQEKGETAFSQEKLKNINDSGQPPNSEH